MSKLKPRVTVTDLPTEPQRGVMLHCVKCGAEYSADRHDYFWKSLTEPFRCACVGRPFLTLVCKLTLYLSPDTRVRDLTAGEVDGACRKFATEKGLRQLYG